MTDDELRVAAERWANKGPARGTAGVGCSVEDHNAGIALAHAYLAEHSADSDAPLDEDWLPSLGFSWHNEWQSWTNDGGRDPSAPCVLLFRSASAPGEWTLQYENDFCWPHALVTRGDVRALLRGLKVPAKEAR